MLFEQRLTAAGDVQHYHIVGVNLFVFNGLYERCRCNTGGVVDVDTFELLEHIACLLCFVVCHREHVAVGVFESVEESAS